MRITSLKSFGSGQGTPNPGGGPVSVGSGLATPPGVEATLEYNGLYLNDREGAEAYLVTTIDGLGDADVRDTREVNPSMHGETHFNAYYGGRTIVLTGKIRAYTLGKLRDMQQALRQTFADVSQERPLTFHSNKTETDVFIMCKKSQPIAMGETQQNFQFERDFQVTLRASNPRFISLLPVFTTITFPESFKTLVNIGNFPAQPFITLEGQMNAPTVANETTGQRIQLSQNVVGAEKIFIDVGRQQMRDQNGLNAYYRLSIDSDWPEIYPGDNVFSVNATNTTLDSIVRFEHRHTTM